MRWPLMVLSVLLMITLMLTTMDASTESENVKNFKKTNVKTKIEIKEDKLIKSIETNLMTLFGFSKRPRPKKEDIVIPKAMLELYRKQTGMEVDTTNFLLPGRLTSSANTVRSFTHEESAVDDEFTKNHRFRLFFPLGNSIPKSERLTSAELHLSRVAMSYAGEFCNRLQILVHDIVLPGIKNKREAITRLIDSQTILTNEDEPVKLDVTPAVERWLEDKENNHGLLVAVVASGPRTTRSVLNKHCSSIEQLNKTINKENFNNVSNNIRTDIEHLLKHVRLKRNTDIHIKDWKKIEPVLLTFTDDGKSRRRSTEDLTKRSRRAVRKHRRKDGRENCRRHEMYVDFGEVGWNDWIVAPPGYNAFYCSGDCPFPLSDHLNSTNHAIVQTLVNSAFPNTAPKACCVPTTLIPISMLYVDEENKVVLKTYDDMMVEGCGCR